MDRAFVGANLKVRERLLDASLRAGAALQHLRDGGLEAVFGGTVGSMPAHHMRYQDQRALHD